MRRRPSDDSVALRKADATLPYARRVKILTSRRIALWDVLAAAERPGSLDSSIVHASALANDFQEFFRAHPQIAGEMYRRFVLPTLGPEFGAIRYECLPSTSPAHAGMGLAKKLVAWRRIKEREA
jgi:hypoxanthine-DNA glycosylase